MRLTPGQSRVKSFVGSLPANKLLTSSALANRLGISLGVLTHWAIAIPPECKAKAKGKNLYGNPKTIAAFKKWQLQN